MLIIVQFPGLQFLHVLSARIDDFNLFFSTDNRGPRLTFDKPLKTLSNGPMAIKWMSNELARFKCGLNPERLEQCGSGTRGREYRRDLRDGTYSLYVGAVDQIGNEAKMIKHTFRIGKIMSTLTRCYFLCM